MTFALLSPVSGWVPAAPSDSCTAGLRLCFAQHKSFPEKGGVPAVPESSLWSFKGKQQRGNHYITQPFLSAEGVEVIKFEMGSVGNVWCVSPQLGRWLPAFQRSWKCCNQLIWESPATSIPRPYQVKIARAPLRSDALSCGKVARAPAENATSQSDSFVPQISHVESQRLLLGWFSLVVWRFLIRQSLWTNLFFSEVVNKHTVEPIKPDSQ